MVMAMMVAMTLIMPMMVTMTMVMVYGGDNFDCADDGREKR